MKKELLRKLGIKLNVDIPITELLSENFNAAYHSLDRRQTEQIHILRNIVTEYNQNIPIDTSKQIKGSQDAAAMLKNLYKGLAHEECWILLLNKNNKVIAKEQMSKGGMSSTAIAMKLIIRKALEHYAAGIIMSHNHPSGDPTPSDSDIDMTKLLRKACSVFDISCIDHIIISEYKYYSFADEETTSFQKGLNV